MTCSGLVKVVLSEGHKSAIEALIEEFKIKPDGKFIGTLGKKSFWHGFIRDWCSIDKYMANYNHYMTEDFMGLLYIKKKWYVNHIEVVRSMLSVGDVLYLTPTQCKALIHLGITI